MKKNMQGFTLIELMIVVAIIAILAAIAIAQYQDYVIRAQVSEGSSLIDGQKTAVAEFYNNFGRFALGGNASYGVSTTSSITGKYVSNVSVSSGTGATGTGGGKISSKFGKGANSKITVAGKDTLVFSPVTHGGSIEWSCKTDTTIPPKYAPTICR